MGGESNERTSVALSGREVRNVEDSNEEYKAEANEISRTLNAAAANVKLVLDRKS